MKKVIVVGAGISGLSAAIYAQKAGFDVKIFEKHIIPGGLSTSWSRKGYLFEGGMHWLTGSNEKFELNKVWKEIGALQENNPIFYRDPFYILKSGDKELCFYRDIKKFYQELLNFASEDKKAIKRLYKDVRLFMGVHMLVNDISGLKAKKHVHPSLSELLKMVPAVFRLPQLINQSYQDYLNMFKNDDVKHLLATIIGARYNALSFIYTIASFASGDCGYPTGGSLRMAKNMAEKFESSGGKIEYRKEVNKIVIENKKVTGVIVNGEFENADSVIVSEDARKAIDTLFENPLKDKWAKNLRKHAISEQNMFVCLGIKADLSKYPKGLVIPLKKPLIAGGNKFYELRINNYAEYENHSPKGCTALTCLLLGDSYEYWKNAKTEGIYKQKKQELAQDFINLIQEIIPEIKDNVEVTDVATPLTYERYCNTYQGGWMSVWKPKSFGYSTPCKIPNVKGLYFAGQRIMMPGGLPIAVTSGRKAAQYLCKDNKVWFN